MKYETTLPIPKEQAETAFQSKVPEEIVHALLGVTHHEADWEWVQDHCLSFLNSPLSDVRNTAIICLGHLARIHRKLDRPKVLAALANMRTNPECSGFVEDALDDIEMFTNEAA